MEDYDFNKKKKRLMYVTMRRSMHINDINNHYLIRRYVDNLYSDEKTLIRCYTKHDYHVDRIEVTNGKSSYFINGLDITNWLNDNAIDIESNLLCIPDEHKTEFKLKFL